MSELFKCKLKRLQIYTSEKDHVDGQPLCEWLVQRACAEGLAGATVLRGIGGYCSGNPVQEPELVDYHLNHPIIVEFIDHEEKLEKFVRAIDPELPHCLMTLEDADARICGGRRKGSNG